MNKWVNGRQEPGGSDSVGRQHSYVMCLLYVVCYVHDDQSRNFTRLHESKLLK